MIWCHLLRWLLRRTLGERYEAAAAMAASPSSSWTEDERDSGLGLPATQLRLAQQLIARQVPVLLGSVVVAGVGLALA